MKRFLVAMALTSLLSVSVFAGDIPISGSPAPAGPSGVIKSGDIPSDGKPGDVPTVGKSELSRGALSVLLSALSFLTR